MNAVSLFTSQLLAIAVIAGIVLLYLRMWLRKPVVRLEVDNDAKPVEPKDYWEGGWSYIGGKFREIKMGDYRAAYCYNYYPKGSYRRLRPKDAAHREAVLSFKEGNYYKAVEFVSDFVHGHVWRSSLKNWVFCVIPASTAAKNEKRFKKFCAEVANETGMADGYEIIKRVTDREDSRKAKVTNTLAGVQIDWARVKGKNVLLFDDVTTRGLSFKQMADALRQGGAARVTGFFLGKTMFE